MLREDLGLIPIEYPTTRQLDASPQARAADLMSAFADPDIRAVLATIGGDDQITVLPHLDPDVVRADPKPFVGYSDNTNLLNWLWYHGIAGYHGGSTMVHLARPGGPHPVSLESLRRALFVSGTEVLEPVVEFSDEHADWADADCLTAVVPTEVEPGWEWHGPEVVVSGTTWGGNVEILHWNLAAGRWIRPVADYSGCILVLETSEEMPSAEEVFRMMRNLGERGLLGACSAVVWGKPKAWSREAGQSLAERAVYRREQYDAVLRATAAYGPAVVVFGPDLGHTDPQVVVPYGGLMTVDVPARRITLEY